MIVYIFCFFSEELMEQYDTAIKYVESSIRHLTSLSNPEYKNIITSDQVRILVSGVKCR